MNPIDILAIIGNLTVMISAIPQIITQVKSKARVGLNPLMPLLWVIGNTSMVTYNVITVKNAYLIFFFSFNLFTALFILYLYYFRSK